MDTTLDDDDDAVDSAVEVVVKVWTCNMRSINVFQLCDIDGVGVGLSGIWWSGIGPVAIRAACALLRVPQAALTDVARDVRFMGSVVAQHRNQLAQAKSD